MDDNEISEFARMLVEAFAMGQPDPDDRVIALGEIARVYRDRERAETAVAPSPWEAG